MKMLLEKIEKYWSTRTEGYSEVNHKELEGMQKEAWLDVLEAEFPKMPKEEIKILDIGTGPGFFPMIRQRRDTVSLQWIIQGGCFIRLWKTRAVCVKGLTFTGWMPRTSGLRTILSMW